jgi:hypothetical protein
MLPIFGTNGENKVIFQPVPNVIQVALGFSLEGSQSKNIINFRFPGLNPEDSMPGLSTELVTWYSDTLQPTISSNVLMSGFDLTYLGIETGRVMHWAPGTALYGGGLAVSSPANVTLAVRFGCGVRGRSGHGRIYQVGIPGVQTSGSYVASAFVSAIVAAWSALLNPAVIFAHKLSVVSRWHKGVVRNPAVSYDVTDITANNVIDSQRRRLPGRGI